MSKIINCSEVGIKLADQNLIYTLPKNELELDEAYMLDDKNELYRISLNDITSDDELSQKYKMLFDALLNKLLQKEIQLDNDQHTIGFYSVGFLDDLEITTCGLTIKMLAPLVTYVHKDFGTVVDIESYVSDVIRNEVKGKNRC